MPTKEHVYWDSDLFISRMQETSGRIEVLRSLTKLAEAGKLLIVTSAFTMCEVAKLPESGLLPQEQEQRIVDFFENPYIILRPVDAFVGQKARELVRVHSGLKGGDALHIATGILAKVPVIQAYNDDFLKLNGKIPGIRIEEPSCDQWSLPLEDAGTKSNQGAEDA